MLKKSILLFLTFSTSLSLYAQDDKKEKSTQQQLEELDAMQKQLERPLSTQKRLERPRSIQKSNFNNQIEELNAMSNLLKERTPPKRQPRLSSLQPSDALKGTPVQGLRNEINKMRQELQDKQKILIEIKELIQEVLSKKDYRSLTELHEFAQTVEENISTLQEKIAQKEEKEENNAPRSTSSSLSKKSYHDSLDRIEESLEENLLDEEKTKESSVNRQDYDLSQSSKTEKSPGKRGPWTRERAEKMAQIATHPQLEELKKNLSQCSHKESSKKHSHCPSFLEFLNDLSFHIQKATRSKTKETIRAFLEHELNVNNLRLPSFNPEIIQLRNSVALSTDSPLSSKGRDQAKEKNRFSSKQS